MPEGDKEDQQPHKLWLIIGSLTLSSAVLITLFEPCIRQPKVLAATLEKETGLDAGDDADGDVRGEMKVGHVRLRTDSGHDGDQDVDMASG